MKTPYRQPRISRAQRLAGVTAVLKEVSGTVTK
jgi:hypothetical protein